MNIQTILNKMIPSFKKTKGEERDTKLEKRLEKLEENSFKIKECKKLLVISSIYNRDHTPHKL